MNALPDGLPRVTLPSAVWACSWHAKVAARGGGGGHALGCAGLTPTSHCVGASAVSLAGPQGPPHAQTHTHSPIPTLPHSGLMADSRTGAGSTQDESGASCTRDKGSAKKNDAGMSKGHRSQ